MKITNLIKYLKDNCYYHKRGTNVSSEIKSKVYASYINKTNGMSVNKFCNYLKTVWLSRSTVKNIISKWEDSKDGDPLNESFWDNLEKSNYLSRYKNTSRWRKIDSFSKEQIDYIVDVRKKEPNKWYKLFMNGLRIPKNKEKFERIFWEWFHLSSRQFYAILNSKKLPKRITKRQKVWLIQKHKKQNTLETYIAKMHNIYASYKSLHKWQVDIKYLTDIPNYVKLWIFDIYLYEITFRDFKSGATMLFFWDDRSKSSVFTAFEIFSMHLKNIWLNLKDIEFQFDWWAEFSNIKINWNKWSLIEMIEKDFWWYRIIDKKEQNGHVEAFHRRIEEDLFDTQYISEIREQLDDWEINKADLKPKILDLLNDYTINFNKYWYSSYQPRLETFGDKSPFEIIKDDWKERIDEWEIDVEYMEEYLGAYDVSKAYSMTRRKDYVNLLSSIIQINENNFDSSVKYIKMISQNYFNEFADFLNNLENHAKLSSFWMNWYK